MQLSNKDGWGTGFFFQISDGLSTSRFIATNYHVCSLNYDKDLTKKSSLLGLVLTASTEGIEETATVIAQDFYHDLCILRAEKAHSAFKLGSFSEVYNVDQSYLLIDSKHTVVGFYAYSKDRDKDKWSTGHRDSYIGVSAAIPGMSGSPIINLNGEVILILWGVNNDAHLGYAITVEALKTLIRSAHVN